MDRFRENSSPSDALARSDEIVDFLLGEGSACERSSVQAKLDVDPAFAIECAELGDLFETLRGLDSEPPASVRMRLALRYALRRREERLAEGPGLRGFIFSGLRTTLVAAAALLMMIGTGWLYERIAGQVGFPGLFSPVDRVVESAQAKPSPWQVETAVQPDFGREDSGLQQLLASTRAVIDDADPSLQRAFHEIELAASASSASAGAGALSFGAVQQTLSQQTLALQVQADNMLSRLREEVSLRENDKVRRRASLAAGGPDLEARVQQLAATIAEQIQVDLAAGQASIAASSGALRALLASGSVHADSPYRDVVEACFVSLRDQVAGLGGGELAVALSGLSEYAVVFGGEAATLVGRHADRLARATISFQVPARPALMHWRTPIAQLAEAGRVLRLAPAFGTHPDLAQRARTFVAAHLAERLGSGAERPSLAAAQLYGFGDIVDRDAAEHRLLLWRANLLIPDYQALHHLAWSKFPVRPGWAQFQTELRGLGGEPTPAATRDVASLLLCLSMNFAAPGALDVALLSRL